MPTMTNPETGETREITLEQMREMMRSGNASIRQVVTHADGTKTETTVFGDPVDDGVDRSVNIFVDKETFNAFLKRKLLKIFGKLEEPELEPNPQLFDMTVDFTDSILMGTLIRTQDSVTVNVYTRNEQKARLDYLSEGKKSWSLDSEGSMSLNPADLQGEDKNITFYMLSFYQMREFLRRCGKLEELQKLGNRASGVILKATDDASDATATIVTGRQRPDLLCQSFLMGEYMTRPYADELMDNMMRGELSLEEKEQEAEAGDADLMEELAMAYLNGDGVPENPEKAVYWQRKLAETGDTNGMFNLALSYAKGHGVTRDFRQAVHWMQKAADGGDEDAPAVAEKYRKAVAALEKLPSGDAQAQADLAGVLMGLAGSLEQAGPGRDYEEAFDLAQKAAAQNNGDGLWTLALAYEHGRGIKKDVHKAIDCYRKGAELGHAPSQHSLACYYLRGDVLQKNEELAFDLIMKSAHQGYGLALRDAGRCYQFGHGVRDDMAKAIEWYEKALEVIDDPELAQKVPLFKTLLGMTPTEPDESTLPEGYDAALEQFMAQEQFDLAIAVSHLHAKYDLRKEQVTFEAEVEGTQYEGRNERIEHIRKGQKVELVREPNNEHNDKNISVRNQRGESLGNMPAYLGDHLAQIMDDGSYPVTAVVTEVIPKSQRGPRAKKSILKLRVIIDLKGAVTCTVCKLGGDQVNIWAQQLTVYPCTMPLHHAKLFFELYNRQNGEYDKLDKGENDTSYAGLDNLEEEIRAAREKMQQQRTEGLSYSADCDDGCDFGTYVQSRIAAEPERYGALAVYGIGEYDDLCDIMRGSSLPELDYYWFDQTRVSEEEWNTCDGYNHWYQIMELYEGAKLPVDLSDQDVVSIFGCDQFAAFADLSYGC